MNGNENAYARRLARLEVVYRAASLDQPELHRLAERLAAVEGFDAAELLRDVREIEAATAVLVGDELVLVLAGQAGCTVAELLDDAERLRDRFGPDPERGQA